MTPGAMNTTPYQPAARSTNNPERTFSQESETEITFLYYHDLRGGALVAGGEKIVKMLEFSDENNFGVCQSDG